MRFIAAFLMMCILAGGVMAAPVAAAHASGKAAVETKATAPSVEKKSEGPPQFAVETFPSQLFWLVVSFGTLYLLLSGAALPRLQQGITARASHIHNLLADAQRLRDDAEAHKNDMTSTADAAYQKAHDMLNRAAAEAQDVANRRNHELEAVMLTKQRASEERIAIARTNAVQSVHDAAQMLVPVITQKLAGLKLTDGQINAAIAGAHGSNDNGHTASRGVA